MPWSRRDAYGESHARGSAGSAKSATACSWKALRSVLVAATCVVTSASENRKSKALLTCAGANTSQYQKDQGATELRSGCSKGCGSQVESLAGAGRRTAFYQPRSHLIPTLFFMESMRCIYRTCLQRILLRLPLSIYLCVQSGHVWWDLAIMAVTESIWTASHDLNCPL